MNISQAFASFKRGSWLSNFSQSNSEARRNPWFIGLLGLVAVFLSVNIVFVAFAIQSNPGLVTDDYYEKGRDYENNVITRIKARNRLN